MKERNIGTLQSCLRYIKIWINCLYVYRYEIRRYLNPIQKDDSATLPLGRSPETNPMAILLFLNDVSQSVVGWDGGGGGGGYQKTGNWHLFETL